MIQEPIYQQWDRLPSILHINYPNIYFFREVYLDPIPLTGITKINLWYHKKDTIAWDRFQNELIVYASPHELDLRIIGPRMVQEMGIRLLLNIA